MSTIRDVAEMAGVSISTVSNVINRNGNVASKTEARVLDAIKALNYVPDYVQRSSRTYANKNIGIITENCAIPISARIVQGICSCCNENDFIPVLHNLNLNLFDEELQAYRNKLGDFVYEALVNNEHFLHRLDTAIQVLRQSNVQGLVYVGDHPRDITPLLSLIPLPCSVVFSYIQERKTNSVNNDDQQGATLAIEHLIANGHKRIAVITGPTNSLATHKRLLGYQETLMKHRINLEPNYIYAGHWSYADGATGLKHLLQLPTPPTAIFVMSDLMAVGTLNAASDMGLHIPDDLSIIGFDDLEFSAYTYPALSTIHTPFEAMGYAAMQKLLAQLGDPSSVCSQLLPCELIQRKSVGSIK